MKAKEKFRDIILAYFHNYISRYENLDLEVVSEYYRLKDDDNLLLEYAKDTKKICEEAIKEMEKEKCLLEEKN